MEALTPIVNDLKSILSDAIVEVNKLVGQPTEIILATVDGTAQITVVELAELLGGLIVVRLLRVITLRLRLTFSPFSSSSLLSVLSSRLLVLRSSRSSSPCWLPSGMSFLSLSCVLNGFLTQPNSEVLGSLVIAILTITGTLLSGLAIATFNYIGAVVAVIVRLNVTTFIHTFTIAV